MSLPGKRKYVITLQSPTTERDDLNTDHISWVDRYRNVKSKRELLGGGESEKANGDVINYRYKFSFHYCPGVAENWRLIEGGKVYDIISVDNFENRNRTLEMICVYRGRVSDRGV